jgi:peptide-methionine (R)-S-oxide reductase
MKRRDFLAGLALGGSMLVLGKGAMAMDLFGKSDKDEKQYPFHLTDEEWRKRLTAEQYKVMRKEGTEATCSSPLHEETRAGEYYCAGCGIALFSSRQKFISKSGWPSFWEPVTPGVVGTSTDYKLGIPRTEVHCNNCGSHLGHVFEDGPPPTGLRYCMNGVALFFVPDEEKAG